MNYEELFIETLKKEFSTSPQDNTYSFLTTAKNIHADDLEKKLPGKTKNSLSKELSKWKMKLNENTFKPTINNLFTFCRISDITPNDILLPYDTDENHDTDENFGIKTIIEFFSENDLVNLFDYLAPPKENTDENNPAQKASDIELPEELILPILYAPNAMAIISIIIYTEKINGTENIYYKFKLTDFLDFYTGFTEYDLHSENEIRENEILKNKDLNLFNTNHNERKTIIKEYYKIFKTFLSNAEDDLHNGQTFDGLYEKYKDFFSNNLHIPFFRYFINPDLKKEDSDTQNNKKSLDENINESINKNKNNT